MKEKYEIEGLREYDDIYQIVETSTGDVLFQGGKAECEMFVFIYK
tara:strand:+ start:375 stop:509 length:135 start_codon:yes stop_codon:yes gene_type:complete